MSGLRNLTMICTSHHKCKACPSTLSNHSGSPWVSSFSATGNSIAFSVTRWVDFVRPSFEALDRTSHSVALVADYPNQLDPNDDPPGERWQLRHGQELPKALHRKTLGCLLILSWSCLNPLAASVDAHYSFSFRCLVSPRMYSTSITSPCSSSCQLSRMFRWATEWVRCSQLCGS